MIKTFEQFNNNLDIDAICKKYNIKNYNIRKDGKVDVNGDVYIRDRNLTELPLYFGVVSGNFECSVNNLISLDGSPKEVGGSFYCLRNNLTSLKGIPEKVGSNLYFENNNITDVSNLLKCEYKSFFIEANPIYCLIKDIDKRDLDVFYMINPLQGKKLSKELYDEVREDLGLPKFDYDTLHKDIELIK